MNEPKVKNLPVPSEDTLRAMKWLLGVAVAALLVWVIYLVAQVNDRADDLSSRLEVAQSERADLERVNEEQSKDIDKRGSAIRTANTRLKDAGKPPVTIPDQAVSVPKVDGQPVLTSSDVLTLIEAEVKSQHPDLTTAQKEALTSSAAVKAAARIPAPEDGADGKDGTDAPSLDDLRPIIRAEVAKIPAPSDGQDGRTPSAEEVAAAITTLCGGDCGGPAGADGKAGVDGQDGVDGTDGRDGVDGTNGVDGKAGQDGKDGRSITAVSCDAAGDWQITFSDGTTSTITGPCRVVTPEPTPDPTTPDPTTTEPTPTSTTGPTSTH